MPEYHPAPCVVNLTVVETPPVTPSQNAQEPAQPLGSPPPGKVAGPAQLPSPPWEGRSGLGVPVRLTQECNRYPNAQPFFTVAYGVRAGNRALITRHTPSRDRAYALLTWFLRDVTDPAVLGRPGPCRPGSDSGRQGGLDRPLRRDFGGRQLPRFRMRRNARGFSARF